MSEKSAKKVLSPEQLSKMQEGRKKAAESRKKAKEDSKKEATDRKNAEKKSDKSDLLKLEMQALEQQQSKINNLKLQVETKKEIKSRLKSIKIVEEEPDVLEEEEEESQDIEIEPQVPKEPTDKKSVVNSEKHTIDEDYKDIFETESKKLRGTLDPSVHKYYDNAVDKFDYNLSLNDNIKTMIDYVKEVVKENTLLAESVKQNKDELDDKKEIVQETIVEKQLTSQINKLMKMRY